MVFEPPKSRASDGDLGWESLLVLLVLLVVQLDGPSKGGTDDSRTDLQTSPEDFQHEKC